MDYRWALKFLRKTRKHGPLTSVIVLPLRKQLRLAGRCAFRLPISRPAVHLAFCLWCWAAKIIWRWYEGRMWLLAKVLPGINPPPFMCCWVYSCLYCHWKSLRNTNLFLLVLGFCLHFRRGTWRWKQGPEAELNFEQNSLFMQHVEFIVVVNTNIYKWI